MCPARRPPPLSLPVDEILRLILEARKRSPSAALPRRLDSLFRELSKTPPPRHPDDIEELIWSLWINHPQDEANNEMNAAIEAINAGAFDLARPILDRVIVQYPDWAEAWNKRATLSFIEKRDFDCLSDIEQTLRLEPRHFGAIAGFGQICLRHGRLEEARAAFQVALALNPHIGGLQEIINELAPSPLNLH